VYFQVVLVSPLATIKRRIKDTIHIEAKVREITLGRPAVKHAPKKVKQNVGERKFSKFFICLKFRLLIIFYYKIAIYCSVLITEDYFQRKSKRVIALL